MLTRLALTFINIFFPPLSVLILTGPYTDTLLNCIFFLLGVIPSHIHGFYISCTYFHRKNKVRKGKYPGGPKTLIYDRKVWNGGASERKVEELRLGMEEGRRGRSEVGRGRRESGVRHGRRIQGDVGVDRRSRGYGDDRRGQAGYRMSEMSEGLGPRRSVLGEMSRRS